MMPPMMMMQPMMQPMMPPMMPPMMQPMIPPFNPYILPTQTCNPITTNTNRMSRKNWRNQRKNVKYWQRREENGKK